MRIYTCPHTCVHLYVDTCVYIDIMYVCVHMHICETNFRRSRFYRVGLIVRRRSLFVPGNFSGVQKVLLIFRLLFGILNGSLWCTHVGLFAFTQVSFQREWVSLCVVVWTYVVYTKIHTKTQTSIHIHIHVCIYIYISVYRYLHIYMHAWMCMHIRIHVYKYIYINIYIYI